MRNHQRDLASTAFFSFPFFFAALAHVRAESNVTTSERFALRVFLGPFSTWTEMIRSPFTTGVSNFCVARWPTWRLTRAKAPVTC